VGQWYDTKASGGEFRHQDSRFRSWVIADGAAGSTGSAGSKQSPRVILYTYR